MEFYNIESKDTRYKLEKKHKIANDLDSYHQDLN